MGRLRAHTFRTTLGHMRMCNSLQQIVDGRHYGENEGRHDGGNVVRHDDENVGRHDVAT